MADGTKAAILEDRGAVFVWGDDARGFLHGLLTNDIEHLAPVNARHAALLSPQGKILFDVMVINTEDGFLLEVGRHLAPDLAKRLGFYKLRAAVSVADVSADHVVAALWDGPADGLDAVVADDPRKPGLGARAILSRDGADAALSAVATLMPAADYHEHRIKLGVPEAGKDYALGDTFPHEADLDLFHGIDFKKGCYVGQEVVSRMHHKTTIRKRVVPVRVPGVRPLEGVDVVAGEQVVGYMGSSNRDVGLAMLRLDKVADAQAAGVPLVAGGLAIEMI